MTPVNLTLHRISLPEFSLGIPMLCSLTREELLSRLCQDDLECFKSKTLVFGEGRRLTIKQEDLNFPPPEFCRAFMDEVYKHFCTGTFWFFGGVLTLMEKWGNDGDCLLGLGRMNYIQLLAAIATLHDPESNPVVLYPVDSLV